MALVAAVGQDRLLEQQRRTAARRFHHPIGDLGDLEMGAHRLANPHQLADPFDRGDEIRQRIETHAGRRVAV